MHGSFKRSQAGQAVVLVAGAALVLTAILALALDGGGIYLERRQLQNAADAGALAGAEGLWAATPPNYASMHSQALATIGKNLGISTSGVVPTNTLSGGSPWSINPDYLITAAADTYTYRVTLQHTHSVVVAPIHGFASTLQLQVQATAQNANLPYGIVLLQSGYTPTFSNLQIPAAGPALNISGPGGGNAADRGGLYSNASIDPGQGNIYFAPCTAGPPVATAGPGAAGDLWAVAETAADGGRVNTRAFCGQTAPANWKVATRVLPDPAYPEPPAPSAVNPASSVSGGITVLCPGRYTNQIVASATSVLYPGVYHAAAGVSVTGTLRTFVSTDSYPISNPCGAGSTLTSWGSFDPGAIVEMVPGVGGGPPDCDLYKFTTGAGSTVTLAPSIRYFNISLYIEALPNWHATCSANQNGSNVVRLTGGGTYNIQGTIYGPADNMQIAGGSGASGLGQVIAWTLVLNGNGNVNEAFDPTRLPYVKGLIQ
ncbi:MAG: pilus assembly protein TadG-related protein [Candidatus Dormibacteraeota bacterium]|nr:pilus assembly protein TadG-related protein [Candidatus Dormibacteraeota bacterium]